MKKLFAISIILLAAATFATAQPAGRQMGTPEERAKVQTDRMIEVLSLSADQQTKVQAIELELAQQQTQRMQNSQGNMDGLRELRQEMENLRDEKYKDVLSEDQFKKYTEDKANRPQGGGRP